MTDIKTKETALQPRTMAQPAKGAGLLFLREEDLRQGIELLMFAYRDFTAGPDAILGAHGLGRAHHRVIHFVGRNPSITVGDLLVLLGITKQSLNRVLQPLLSQGVIAQRPGTRDRRQRQLSLTDKGIELEQRLSAPQRSRVAAAFREAGPEAVAGFRKVLSALIDPSHRESVLAAINHQ